MTNRASDVPPVVDSFGVIPVSACTAALTRSDKAPGGVKKLSPDTRTGMSMFTPNSAATASTWLCIHAITDALVCRSLNRTFAVARHDAGLIEEEHQGDASFVPPDALLKLTAPPVANARAQRIKAARAARVSNTVESMAKAPQDRN